MKISKVYFLLLPFACYSAEASAPLQANDESANKETYVHGKSTHIPKYEDFKEQEKLALQKKIIGLYERCVEEVDYPLIMVFGGTGSGKSTLINYLNGKKLVHEKGKVKVAKDEKNYAGIGHGRNSKTMGVQFFNNGKLKLTFCDTEGFLGNRPANEPYVEKVIGVYTPYFILLAHRKKIRGIIWTVNKSALGNPRDKGLEQVVACLVKHFGAESMSGLKKSTLMVITYCEDLNMQNIISNLITLIKSVNEAFFFPSGVIGKALIGTGKAIYQGAQVIGSAVGGVVEKEDKENNNQADGTFDERNIAEKKVFLDLFLEKKITKKEEIEKLGQKPYRVDLNMLARSAPFRKVVNANYEDDACFHYPDEEGNEEEYIFNESNHRGILKKTEKLSNVPVACLRNVEFPWVKGAIHSFSEHINFLLEQKKSVEEMKKFKKEISELENDQDPVILDKQLFRKHNAYADYDLGKDIDNASSDCYKILNNEKVDTAIRVTAKGVVVAGAIGGGAVGGLGGAIGGAVVGGAVGLFNYLSNKVLQKIGGGILGGAGALGVLIVGPIDYAINGYLCKVFYYNELEVIDKIECKSSNGAFGVKIPSLGKLKSHFSLEKFTRNELKFLIKKDKTYNQKVEIYFSTGWGEHADASFVVWGKACNTKATKKRIDSLKELIAKGNKINQKELDPKIKKVCIPQSLNFLSFSLKSVILPGYAERNSLEKALANLGSFLKVETKETVEKEDDEKEKE